MAVSQTRASFEIFRRLTAIAAHDCRRYITSTGHVASEADRIDHVPDISGDDEPPSLIQTRSVSRPTPTADGRLPRGFPPAFEASPRSEMRKQREKLFIGHIFESHDVDYFHQFINSSIHQFINSWSWQLAKAVQNRNRTLQFSQETYDTGTEDMISINIETA
jgi:hypothetical protein